MPYQRLLLPALVAGGVALALTGQASAAESPAAQQSSVRPTPVVPEPELGTESEFESEAVVSEPVPVEEPPSVAPAPDPDSGDPDAVSIETSGTPASQAQVPEVQEPLQRTEVVGAEDLAGIMGGALDQAYRALDGDDRGGATRVIAPVAEVAPVPPPARLDDGAPAPAPVQPRAQDAGTPQAAGNGNVLTGGLSVLALLGIGVGVVQWRRRWVIGTN